MTGLGKQDATVQAEAPPGLQASPPSSVLIALTQAPFGIALFDRDMRYLAASSQFLIDQGLPGDTPLVGRLHYEVFPEIPQRWRDLHAQVLRDGMELRHEADPYVTRDGRKEWIRWKLAPWRDEAGKIGGVVLYTELVTSSVEARLRLETTERQYRAVFDQSAMGVARVGPDGRFLEVNDRFCAICRWPRDDLLRRRFHEITHPDDLGEDLDRVRELLDGRIDTFSMEKRYVSRMAETIWANLTVSLVRTPQGKPAYFVSIIEDIAVRKQAEAAQGRYQDQLRLLINELNHRVKNTLATVQSIAAQTLRREADPATAYGKFEARLLGLSEVHELLTRERWHGASLEEVADRALRPFADANEQVAVRGPPVWLQPGAALTMALVIHELATNAGKYGALSVDAGRVDLTWTFDPVSDALEIRWAESGGPPVRPPTKKGFGSRLIERALRSELGGSARADYAPSGLVCTLRARAPQTVPAANPFDAV